MNIRKPVDYGAMYETLDQLIATDLPQVELYFEIGQVVCARAEKGAAVAASEYLQVKYPHTTGFSPRNLRRMREIYRTYKSDPELLQQAMKINWTQNMVILETCKTTEERIWYIAAVVEYNWTKTELLKKIQDEVWLNSGLDEVSNSCYTKEKIMLLEHPKNDKNSFYQSPKYLSKSSSRVCNEELGAKSWTGETDSNRFGSYQPRGNWTPSRFTNSSAPERARNRLLMQNSSETAERRLRQIRFADWDGSRESPRYVPYLRRRFRWEDAPSDRICGATRPGSSGSLVHRQF